MTMIVTKIAITATVVMSTPTIRETLVFVDDSEGSALGIVVSVTIIVSEEFISVVLVSVLIGVVSGVVFTDVAVNSPKSLSI